MIDYEKLKIVHDLARKLTVGTGNRCDINVSVYDDDEALFGIIWNRETTEYLNIDSLIKHIQELTRPEPMYKIGDSVYWMDGRNQIQSGEVVRIDNEYSEFVYYATDNKWYIDEEHLYPTKQALIDSQIEYWQKLKVENYQPKFEGKVLGVKCEHESDGTFRNINNPRDSSTFETPIYQPKCIKCGEFY